MALAALAKRSYHYCMTQQIDIRKAGAVIIKDRKFLVTRATGKDIFVAPGDRLEAGESHEQALKRELREELRLDIDETKLKESGTFTAPAAGHEGMVLEMKVFLVDEPIGEIIPSNEVEEIKWVNTQTHGVPLGSIFEHDVMPLLKQKDLID